MSEIRGDDPLGGVPHHVSNPAFAPGMGSTRPAIPETDVTDIGEGEDAVEEVDEATIDEQIAADQAELDAKAAAEAEEAAAQAAAAQAAEEEAAAAQAEEEAAAAQDGPHEEQTEPEEGEQASDGSGGEA